MSRPLEGENLSDDQRSSPDGGAIDWSMVEKLSELPGAYPHRWGANEQREVDQKPSRLLFHLGEDFEQTVAVIAAHLGHEADDPTFIRLAKGAVYEICTWMWRRGHHTTDYEAAGLAFQNSVLALLNIVFARGTDVPSVHDDRMWADAVMRLWFIAYDGREADTPREMVDELAKVAGRELGRTRGLIRNADPHAAGIIFDRESDNINAATRLLYATKGLWGGMKPLLLLVRASPTPVFASDLSWWNAAAEPKRTRGTASIAERLMFGFQAFARFEQDADARLVSLRTELSKFCLQRLKTDRKAGAPIEPSAVWRIACVRAATELGLNPEGKGHRILHNTERGDPDPDVRKAAADAYTRLRHNDPLPDSISPRRAILRALWWLRQAHMLELGIEVDPKRAQATQREEIRFTTMRRSAN